MEKTLTGQWLDELAQQLVAMHISGNYVLHKPLKGATRSAINGPHRSSLSQKEVHKLAGADLFNHDEGPILLNTGLPKEAHGQPETRSQPMHTQQSRGHPQFP
jgi:hypothetical protein